MGSLFVYFSFSSAQTFESSLQPTVRRRSCQKYVHPREKQHTRLCLPKRTSATKLYAKTRLYIPNAAHDLNQVSTDTLYAQFHVKIVTRDMTN